MMKNETTQPETTEERYFYLVDYSTEEIPGCEEKIYSLSLLEVGYSEARGVWTAYDISCIVDEYGGVSEYHREESYSTLEPLKPALYIHTLITNDKTLFYPFWETLISEMEKVQYIR